MKIDEKNVQMNLLKWLYLQEIEKNKLHIRKIRINGYEET